jgi:hypothetical protein
LGATNTGANPSGFIWHNSLGVAALRLLVLSLLSVAAGVAQPVPLENFSCSTGAVTASPSGGPTTIQCLDAAGNPQNLIFPTGSHVMLWGATGNWTPLNTQTMQLLKMVMSSTGTTVYLNDTGMMENTPGSTWQIWNQQGSVPYCGNGTYGSEQVTLGSITDGRSIVLSARGVNTTTATPHCNEDLFWGPLDRSNTWAITIVDSTHFSVPLDSSSFGSFAGQTIHINRASAANPSSGPYLLPSGADGAPPLIEITSNGYELMTIDGCPSTSNAITCSFGYIDPFNAKGYGDFGTTGSLVVSGGTGTITVSSWNNNTTQYTRTLQANELMWLNNFTESASTYGTINRPWVINTVTGTCSSSCTITIANMGTGQGGAGVSDGTYTVSTSGHNFFFPLFADYYAYWGPGEATIGDYPTEYPAHMVEGTFSSSFNRYRAWYCWSATMTAAEMEFGSYVVEQPSEVSWHGYHSLNFDTYGSTGACQWQIWEINAFPYHWVGGPSWSPQGTDSTYTGFVGFPAWTGETYHYFDINRTFYMNLSNVYSLVGAQTSYIGPMYMDTVAAEPEEWVMTKSATYNPGTGKYHMNMVVSPGVSGGPCSSMTYNFYYSTSELKALGLNNATADGSTSAAEYGVLTQYQVIHDTAALPYGNYYFGIRPNMCVSGVSGNGVSPIVLSFRQDPNMQVGDHVNISGVGGNTNANQSTVAITNVYPRQFWFHSNQGHSPPVTLTNIVVTSGSPNVCTVDLTVAPGVVAGQEIGVTGVTSGGPGYSNNYQNVTWFTVTSVSGDSFTFSCPGTTAGTYNTDANLSGNFYMAVVADPAIAISGTGNGNWDGNYTGTMVSTENNKNFSEISFLPPATSFSVPALTSVLDQALGLLACTTGDLNHDGVCNILDVQLEIDLLMSLEGAPDAKRKLLPH